MHANVDCLFSQFFAGILELKTLVQRTYVALVQVVVVMVGVATPSIKDKTSGRMQV